MCFLKVPPGIVVAWRPGCWLACPSPVTVLVLVLVPALAAGRWQSLWLKPRPFMLMFMA